jgi:hypothetical protein
MWMEWRFRECAATISSIIGRILVATAGISPARSVFSIVAIIAQGAGLHNEIDVPPCGTGED